MKRIILSWDINADENTSKSKYISNHRNGFKKSQMYNVDHKMQFKISFKGKKCERSCGFRTCDLQINSCHFNLLHHAVSCQRIGWQRKIYSINFNVDFIVCLGKSAPQYGVVSYLLKTFIKGSCEMKQVDKQYKCFQVTLVRIHTEKVIKRLFKDLIW